MIKDLSLHTRQEERFLVFDVNRFTSDISRFMEEVTFSDRPVVRTIYFCNDNHSVPFRTAIKARKYMNRISKIPEVDMAEPHLIDFKEGGGIVRERTRSTATLEEALDLISGRYPALPRLRPYVAIDYRRKHFVPTSGETNIRVTIDLDTTYHYITPKRDLVRVCSEEDYARVELKAENPDDPILSKLYRLVEKQGNFPIVPKKFMAYNSVGFYLARVNPHKTKLAKELGEVEVEAKLEASPDFPLELLKANIAKGELEGFGIPAEFPLTFETASFNRYYQEGRFGFKALLLGNTADIVRKGETTVLADPYDLGCILYRSERTDSKVPITSSLLRDHELLGKLFRMKKSFILANKGDSRLYHVSIDFCASGDRNLHQVEIEYIGRMGEHRCEQPLPEITEDIAKITRFVIDRYDLRPTQMTKEDWLLQR